MSTVRGVAPEADLRDIFAASWFAASWPFFGLFILAMAIICVFPPIATLLPGLLS